jgi:hypothetical protein
MALSVGVRLPGVATLSSAECTMSTMEVMPRQPEMNSKMGNAGELALPVRARKSIVFAHSSSVSLHTVVHHSTNDIPRISTYLVSAMKRCV